MRTVVILRTIGNHPNIVQLQDVVVAARRNELHLVYRYMGSLT